MTVLLMYISFDQFSII